MSLAAASPGAVPRGIPVRDLVARIRLSLEEAFPTRLWVEGELTGFRVGRGGHGWGALRDDAAQVEVVLWKDTLAGLRFTPADGMQVLALVRKVDFWGPSGRLRVQIERLEPSGLGALHRALEERRTRLAAEGLFDEARKRPLPLLPRVVGIVTAPTGAAIHDMLRILGERFAERRILLRPCKVQGEGAAADIAQAIDDLGREASAEVIIVGRGGGSAEDLWAFNEEAVVRAIVRSRVPVVSAVGHEVDWTLADLAADLRVATPTAAAQRVMPERSALEVDVHALARRLRDGLARRTLLSRSRLEARAAQLVDPRGRLREMHLRLGALGSRCREALRGRTPRLRERLARATIVLRGAIPGVARRRDELGRLGARLRAAAAARPAVARRELATEAARLDALSPLAVLGRGFALARSADGRIVRDAASLSVGEEVGLRFSRGTARARVLETRSGDIDAPPVALPPGGTRRG